MGKQIYIHQLFDSMMQMKKLMDHKTNESRNKKRATMMQFTALMYLREHKNATVSDIAARLRLSKSSATQLVERLVNVKFAKRIDDTNDRRIVHIGITPAGEAQYIKLNKIIMEKLEHVLANVSAEDLKELVRIHHKIIASLQKEEKK